MLRYIVHEDVPFAIKSGGHATITGFSNINSTGVTLDLALLSAVKLSEDYRTVEIGPGARWADVYDELEKSNLTAPGGRAGVVGTGGFVLGGGINWYSNLEGWSCDSVEAFEVVLADGSIVEASSHAYADLFWVLKGGGSLFGVVTNVKMRTMHSEGIFGGGVNYDAGQEDSLFQELVSLSHNIGPGDRSSGYAICAFSPQWGTTQCSSYMVDLEGRQDSVLLKGLKKLKQKGSNLRRMKMSESAADMSSDALVKYRQAKFAITVQSDTQTLIDIYGIFLEARECMALKDEDRVAMTFQPFSANHLSGRDNALGFGRQEKPLILFSFEVRWSSESRDDHFESQSRTIYDRVVNLTKARGTLHPYVYANYAAGFQNPFASYGTDSLERLKAVRDRFDPAKVFSILQAGGLKL
ncbi:MAG: hypothetical protein Q9227_005622 [Pyrenula ochraceoflavens]